jgi:hypothetical protein
MANKFSAYLEAHSEFKQEHLRKPWQATVPTLKLTQESIARRWANELNWANAGHTNDWQAKFVVEPYEPSLFDYKPDNVVKY